MLEESADPTETIKLSEDLFGDVPVEQYKQGLFRPVADELPIVRDTPRGKLVVETLVVDGLLITMTGHGVLDDPETYDDSWTWEIYNPPVLVPDEAGDVRTKSGALHRVDPLGVLYAEIDYMGRK